MKNHPTSDLVGKVAYRILKHKFISTFSDEDSDEAFFALDHFSPHELQGFIKEAQADKETFDRLKILFPKNTVEGADIDERYVTDGSAVSVRNKKKDGKVVITSANEEDVRESLGNKTILSTTDLSSDDRAHTIWAEVLISQQPFTIGSQTKGRLRHSAKRSLSRLKSNCTRLPRICRV